VSISKKLKECFCHEQLHHVTRS